LYSSLRALRRRLASSFAAVVESHGSGFSGGTRSRRRHAIANVSAATSSAVAGSVRRRAKRSTAA
jgi:hypothetical protein